MSKRLCRLAVVALFSLSAAGCGSGGGGGATDAGTTGSSMCGTSGEKMGNQCSSLSECGAGPANAMKVEFCEHCFGHSDTAVCESGTCRMLMGGATTNVKAGFTIPGAATGAKSFTIATIVPVMADGSHVTCAALMSAGCTFTNNYQINATASRFRNFASPADVSIAYTELIAADPGDDRLVFIAVTTDVQGKGDVKAMGCTEHVSLPAGMTTGVEVMLH